MSADDPEDYGAKPNTWNALVRRARIGIKLKAAALIVSTYASPSGRDVKCGVARLATDCEVSYSTARRYLAWMREVGLIELVRPGNHYRKRADEYRLIVGPDVHARLDIPESDEYRKLIEGVNESNFESEKKRRLRSPKASAEPTESDESSALTKERAQSADVCAHSDAPLRSSLCDLLPTTSITDQGRAPTTGGAPPPDPRRRLPPSASANEPQRSLSAPLTPAPRQESYPLPRVDAGGAFTAEHVAPVYDFFTREAI
jgi:DNA-binding transcriptional ArsR family regulator